ncbi:MAG: Nif11-like leader peptide family natural product precursor [Phormidium sp. BM_Day4_Bin.17]|nr:Nif11-like leader peptide family natural product precursor [Phormidium sp. BM_Day4_Bin.17]UCJ10432.1 MAG: Nif11-like leader peptide family RiPP precursor [Phormidium sp. PBR-2020]
MSIENAEQFLKDALNHPDLRESFNNTETPEQFLTIARGLGYDFSSQDLKTVISDHSEGVNIRRRTGIWQWLRTVPWIDRQESHH